MENGECASASPLFDETSQNQKSREEKTLCLNERCEDACEEEGEYPFRSLRLSGFEEAVEHECPSENQLRTQIREAAKHNVRREDRSDCRDQECCSFVRVFPRNQIEEWEEGNTEDCRDAPCDNDRVTEEALCKAHDLHPERRPRGGCAECG